MSKKINQKINQKKWVILADGEKISAEKIKKLAEDKGVLVLDGAYEYAEKIGLAIDFLLGDFDSIGENKLEKIKSDVFWKDKIIHAPDQNKTDLEKGIEYLDINFSPDEVLIISGLGLRLQHSLYNLRLLKKLGSNTSRKLKIISETERVTYHHGSDVAQRVEIIGQPGDCVAILGFPFGKFSSEGLQYDVKNYALDFEKNNSVSNALKASKAVLSLEGDVLLIQEIKK